MNQSQQEDQEEQLVQRAILVGVDRGQDSHFDASMEELGQLAEACGIAVETILTQKLSRIHSRTYIGEGKLDEVKSLLEQTDTDLVIFNDELSPSQIRNLEEVLTCTVMDRSSLILEIFASRARTREARLQVEVARLSYLLPRLVGSYANLSRQAGGVGTTTRGGGETKLELDRRQIEERIHRLNRSLAHLVESRQVQRKSRKEQGLPVVALVGYTNTGKSSLLNRLLVDDDSLAGKKVEADDMLFATLQTAVRKTRLTSGRSVLLTDTVGFVDRLPHHLVKAFRSTLEEVKEADLLLHVVDYGHPEYEKQIRITEDTLRQIGVENIPTIYVYNKVDLHPDPTPMGQPRYVFVSAKEGTGLEELETQMESALFGQDVHCRMLIPFHRGELVSYFQEHAQIREVAYGPEGTLVDMDCARKDWQRYGEFLVD